MVNHRKYFRLVLLCLLLFSTIFSRSAAGQQPASEYQVKAVFLYNFTRFITWPSLEGNEKDFVIGIYGSNPFGSHLEEAIAGEKIEGRNIRVRVFKKISEINDCDILYIHSTDHDEIKRVLAAMTNKPTLTVCEADRFVNWGGIIRLYTEQNKIRIQINTRAADEADLSISSKLLNVAKVY